MTSAGRSFSEVIDSIKNVEGVKQDGQARALSMRALEIFRDPILMDLVSYPRGQANLVCHVLKF